MAAKLSSVLQARIAIRLNSLSLQKKFLGEAAPLVFLGVMACGIPTFCSRGNDRFDAAYRQILAQPIGVVCFVAEEGTERHAFDQCGNASGFATLPWHQQEAYQIA